MIAAFTAFFILICWLAWIQKDVAAIKRMLRKEKRDANHH